MNNVQTERLNSILPRITSDTFLSGSGIGNELGFYVFDYPPEEEIDVRKHIRFLIEHIPRQRPGLLVKHVNLFDLVLKHLEERKLLDRALAMQRTKGDEHVRERLSTVLDADKVAPIFIQDAQPSQHHLVLVSGVGSAWPLVRTHGLLNNLHGPMGGTPLVLFYPGRYDRKSLRLFGKLKNDNYYRAFQLVP